MVSEGRYIKMCDGHFVGECPSQKCYIVMDIFNGECPSTNKRAGSRDAITSKNLIKLGHEV